MAAESEKACLFPVLPPRRKSVYRSIWQTDNHRIKCVTARAEGEPGKNGRRYEQGQRHGRPRHGTRTQSQDGRSRWFSEGRGRSSQMFFGENIRRIRGAMRLVGNEGVGEHVRTRFHRKQRAAGEIADL